MRYDEAEQIRKMIDGHWNLKMDSATADMWMSALLPLDAEAAMKAVARLAKTMHYAPKIADLGELMRREDRTPPPPKCGTCGGDRAVLYTRRPAEQSLWMKEKKIEPPSNGGIEEYTPCPDCNAKADASYFRYDRSHFQPPDPARVRAMLEA